MQDRFKFRTWNTLVKKFSYFDEPEIQIGTNEFDSGLIFPLSENSKLYIGKYSELQFCTGLKDKNGKLIYEGDIVQFYNDGISQTMKIVWDDDELDFKAIGLKKNVECYGQDFLYLGCIKKENSLEIIGNIYQNLLKEGS
ncbi:YopX family protein [Intestinibacter sp.]|uniref:YopX family protein n=1 Tax=Intestinibacter sp. TaxID=1965304 RepID=UPI002A918B3D|nr:YopX family protein [Intestinibacter sp.]MDY5213175.1 YopX family protein [Intestinibacter sp.]